MSDSFDTKWTEIDRGHYVGVVDGDGRRVVHEYLVCGAKVIEIDKLFEEGMPKAVFRSVLTPDEVGVSADDSEEEIQDQLRKFAFDAPEFQLVQEFDASVEVFED